jgi:hypothetical protein
MVSLVKIGKIETGEQEIIIDENGEALVGDDGLATFTEKSNFTFIPDSLAVSKLSDMMFLAKKEFDGKLVEDEGTLSVTGDLCSLTASTGKDMYLASAKISIFNETDNTGNDAITVVLKVNDVIKETYTVRTGSSTGGTNVSGQDNYEFNLKGVKVLATEIIKLEVTSIDANVGANGQLTCFEEDTDADPSI